MGGEEGGRNIPTSVKEKFETFMLVFVALLIAFSIHFGIEFLILSNNSYSEDRNGERALRQARQDWVNSRLDVNEKRIYKLNQ